MPRHGVGSGVLLVTIVSAQLALSPFDVAPFVFALALTNQLASYSGSARVSVWKSGAATLPLTLSGPAFQSASRATSFGMQASTGYATTALCGDRISSLSVAFAWTQLLAGAPALAAFPNVTIGGTSLVGQTLGAALPGLDIRAGAAAFGIPGFAVTVGHTYVFQVTMTTVVRLASQSVASAPTSVSALVTVRFVAAPLVARIEGGDRQGMGSGMNTGGVEMRGHYGMWPFVNT